MTIALNMMFKYFLPFFFFLFLFLQNSHAESLVPYQAQHLDYHLDPQIYSDILKDRPTELWARVYYPTLATHSNPAPLALNKVPVIVIMHGNHSTCGSNDFPRLDNSCEYTMKHQCSGDYSVVQNHLGFEYLSNELAKNGILVVSVNANLGISCGEGIENDSGLTLARGRLILKHLQLLSDWNRGLNKEGELASLLFQKIDLSRVGLIGHSRGGEGVRAALNLYTDLQEKWYSKIGPLKFKAIFEMAPIDGQALRMMNPVNVAWNVLLPACDQDVPHLDGIKVFDRMTLRNSESVHFPKSAMLIWGTNHNFFNTEWQTSDSLNCFNHTPLFPLYPGSTLQRQIAIETAVPFFKNYLGEVAHPELVQFFDPLYPIKEELKEMTTIERSYVSLGKEYDRYSLPLETFFLTPKGGTLPALSQVEYKPLMIPEHESVVVGSQLSWKQASQNTYAQFNWGDEEFAPEFPSDGFFEMRLGLADQDTPESLDFSIQFAGIHNQLSEPLKVSKYLNLLGPAGKHHLLQTLKIPVKDIHGIKELRGMRFIFDQTESGKIYLNALYLREPKFLTQNFLQSVIFPAHKKENQALTSLNSSGQISSGQSQQIQKVLAQTLQAQLVHKSRYMGFKKRTPELTNTCLNYQITFYSEDIFEAKSSLFALSIGNELFDISGPNPDGNLHHINFYLSEESKNKLQSGSPMKIFYLSAPENEVWDAGVWK
jgi:hypothetical protein